MTIKLGPYEISKTLEAYEDQIIHFIKNEPNKLLPFLCTLNTFTETIRGSWHQSDSFSDSFYVLYQLALYEKCMRLLQVLDEIYYVIDPYNRKSDSEGPYLDIDESYDSSVIDDLVTKGSQFKGLLIQRPINISAAISLCTVHRHMNPTYPINYESFKFENLEFLEYYSECYDMFGNIHRIDIPASKIIPNIREITIRMNRDFYNRISCLVLFFDGEYYPLLEYLHIRNCTIKYPLTECVPKLKTLRLFTNNDHYGLYQTPYKRPIYIKIDRDRVLLLNLLTTRVIRESYIIKELIR
jgi:hypothetical protein